VPGIAAPADAPAAVAAFAARTAVIADGSNGSATAVCREAPNATAAWALHAVFWPDAPAALRAAAPCPAVEADAPAVLSLSLDVARRITVAAAAPLRGQAGSALHVTLAGTRAAGAACAPTPDGTGTIFTLALPAGPAAGSSVVVECVLSASAVEGEEGGKGRTHSL